MYKKYLTLVLLVLTSGSMIGASIQFYNDYQYVFAQTNQAPEADDQDVSVDANDNVKITLKGNDDDKDDEIEFEIVSDPSHGELDNFDKSDGTVTYTPEEEYSGDDKFEFKVIDDKGAESDKASVEIEVKAINQAPEADDQDVSVDANDNVKITLKGNDDDKDDEIEFEIVSDPSHGELDNFDKSDGTVTYTPEEEYSGDDKFEFKVIDEKGDGSDKAEIKINVEPLEETNQEVSGETNQELQNQTSSTASENNVITTTNQSPIAHDQEFSTDANTDIDITLVGEDTDNDPIQFEIVSNPVDATLNDFDNVKGTVTYSPEMNYTGNDSFSFKVVDDNGVESNVATVDVVVKETTENILTKESAVIANESSVVANESSNNAPTAFDQNTSVSTNNQLNITLTGEDTDNDPIQFEIVSNPADATLNDFDNAKGTVTYSPEMNYTGNDSFSFKVVDDNGVESNVATVDVVVKETTENILTKESAVIANESSVVANESSNNAPTAFDQNTSVSTNNQLNITLTGEDTDNDPIQFEIVSNPADATLNDFDNAKGTVTYSPEMNYTGNDSFSFKVVDDNGVESNVATVNVEVKPTTENILKESAVMANESSVVANESSNNAPTAFDQNISVSTNNQLNITLTVEDTDNDPILF